MESGIQRWTAKRKSELVLQLIKGEKTLVEICWSQDLKQSEVQGWMDAYMKSGEQGLKTNAKGEQSQHTPHCPSSLPCDSYCTGCHGFSAMPENRCWRTELHDPNDGSIPASLMNHLDLHQYAGFQSA